MDILPIQSTSVPCERVFSSSKETDTLRRSRLSPEMMEALQILKFAIRSGGGLNFTESLSLEAELERLEALTHDSVVIRYLYLRSQSPSTGAAVVVKYLNFLFRIQSISVADFAGFTRLVSGAEH